VRGLLIHIIFIGLLLVLKLSATAQENNLDDILKTSDSLAQLYGNATTAKSEGPLRIIAVAGGSLSVPEGKTWTVENVSVGDGSGFNISVNSMQFPDTLFPGDQIKVPVFGSESHLLDNPSDATYTFTINERDYVQND
jgi:hypothetical protein